MKNLDTLKQEKLAIMQQIHAALKAGDDAAFQDAFGKFTENLQEAVMLEAHGLVQAADAKIMAGRGVRQLTSDENKYYQAVLDAMKTNNPKQALADISEVMPKTIIDEVFVDLVAEHPLLEVVDFQNTSGLIEFLVNTNSVELATWGVLTAEITKELTGGFKKVNMSLNKLSAFLPIAKSMLDLGPAYMDRFVRAMLGEALAYGLEEGIVDGTGKNMPIGMNRQVGTGVVVTDGVYPEKATIAITDLTPATYATLLGTLTTAPNGKKRKVAKVALIVNPTDYMSKIFPATTIRGADGQYVNNVFPFPTDVIQSVEVPSGKAIMGLPGRYFMGIGTQKSGKIEFSDEYKFLEDERVYLVKLYGHGEPKDNNAFLYLDISGLVATPFQVGVANWPADYEVSNLEEIIVPAYPDARLASLTIGSLTLSPAFNKSVFVYTAATTNATNTITAVAKDGEATVAITVDEAPHTNGTAATWSEGENEVEVTVTVGGETETYSVVVTKTT